MTTLLARLRRFAIAAGFHTARGLVGLWWFLIRDVGIIGICGLAWLVAAVWAAHRGYAAVGVALLIMEQRLAGGAQQ